jgi:hypothetical protein
LSPEPSGAAASSADIAFTVEVRRRMLPPPPNAHRRGSSIRPKALTVAEGPQGAALMKSRDGADNYLAGVKLASARLWMRFNESMA